MKVLLDTQMLLWAAVWPGQLPDKVRSMIVAGERRICFSPISILEVSIKNALGRKAFAVDSGRLRAKLLDRGGVEIPVTGVHAAKVAELPMLHKDPFDRVLLAQAICEEVELLTSDAVLARYPGPVVYVRKQ